MVSSKRPEKKSDLFKSKKKHAKKFSKKNKEENFKVIVDLKKNNSNNLKKVLEETAKKSKRLRELRDKRRALKGLPPLSEKTALPQQTEKIWFEVDKVFLPEELENKNQDEDIVTKTKITKAVAIDCEMVGVGEDGKDSILARVSIVNQYGEVIYDKYVVPTENVTDYRTHVSGIRPEDLKKQNAHPFKLVQDEVSKIIEGKTLVGHALHNDLQVLLLSHPKKKMRDTQKCKLFRQKFPFLGSLASLKNLAKVLLGISIQDGEHNSTQDAQAAMRIYTSYKKEWEQFLRDKKSGKLKKLKEGTEIAIQTIQTATNLDNIKIKGNENHKKYVKNKLKKRLNKNRFPLKK